MFRSGLAAALLIVSGCGGSGGSPIAPTPTTISSLASSHLNQMLDIMQANSLHRARIDWSSLRANVMRDAGAAQTIPDLYPAIRGALGTLRDGHSFYQTPSGGRISVPTRTCSASPTSTPTLPPTIGYVKVGTCECSGAAATAFAEGIQAAIAAADRDDLVGWVVDLRGNRGGNMWPMIAGVGPVLGEGTLGYAIDPIGGIEFMWQYAGGASINGDFVREQVTSPYRLRRERPKVAVLSDGAIGSSGEATLIAFRQRPNTRSFGTPTCGLSTVNLAYTLTEGAFLYLTVGVMADRTRTLYGDIVVPDEVITDAAEAAQRAVAWLAPR